jgi:hypothetical protein
LTPVFGELEYARDWKKFGLAEHAATDNLLQASFIPKKVSDYSVTYAQ